jgi:chromosome partitioning protein
MKIISFLGRKGGVGKTNNAHATAHGLTMLGVPAAYILTDHRELLSDENRVYTIIDGRTVPQLERAIATVRQSIGGTGVFVIDGGGNRGPVDDLLASVSDVIVLPFTADDDSVNVVNEEMAHFPGAWAMPSNWTTNSKALAVDAGYIEKLEANYPGRLLLPTPSTHAIRDLMLLEFSGVLLPAAQQYCRALARRLLDLLDRERAGETAATNIVALAGHR